jgi:hypothetical protein
MNSILLKISVQLVLPPFLAFLSLSLFPFCLWITLYISAGQAFIAVRRFCLKEHASCVEGTAAV